MQTSNIKGIKCNTGYTDKKAIVKPTFEDANNYMKDGVYLRQVIDVIDEIEFDDVKESYAFGMLLGMFMGNRKN